LPGLLAFPGQASTVKHRQRIACSEWWRWQELATVCLGHLGWMCPRVLARVLRAFVLGRQRELVWKEPLPQRELAWAAMWCQ